MCQRKTGQEEKPFLLFLSFQAGKIVYNDSGRFFMKKRNAAVIRLVVPLAYLSMIIVNYLANALPLGGLSTGEVSDLYPNLFVPSGFTFSIWGIIYLLLGASVVFFITRIGSHDAGLYRKLAVFFVITCVFNMAWIFSWQYRLPGLSFAVMILLFFTLNAIKIILWDQDKMLNQQERIFLNLPFSFYFAWINIALLANLTALKIHLGWSRGVSDMFWAMMMIFIAVILTIYRVVRRHDIVFPIVTVWALTGIIHKRMAFQEAREVALAAVTGLLAVAVALIVTGIDLHWKRKKSVN